MNSMICYYVKICWGSSYKFYRLVSFKLKDNCSSTPFWEYKQRHRSQCTTERAHVCAFFLWHHTTTAKLQNLPKWPSSDEWLEECVYVYTIGFYSGKKQTCHFLGNGNELEIIILSKIIQIQNDKYHKFLSYVEPMFL